MTTVNEYEIRNSQKPSNMRVERYQPFTPIDLPDRSWPSKVIDKAPR
ncbi:MAG: hypothetical protein RLZZ163_317, partial [Actinomycetota bacterium]